MRTAAKILLYSLTITLITGIILVFSDVISVEVINIPYSDIALQFVFTITAILLLTKGKLSKYGFRLPQKIAVRIIIPWVFLFFIFGYFINLFFEGKHPIEETGLVTKIFLGLIIAPILEEVVFRGLIQSYLSRFKHIGIKIAKGFFSYPVIFAALLFSFAHLPMIIRDINADLVHSIFSLTYIFGVGVLIGYVREKTDSLIPAVIIHFLINLFALLSASFLNYN